MSWETFWAPNLIQWIVGGAISAAVGFIVLRSLRLVRDVAQSAATAADSASTAAGTAASHAGTAATAAGEALEQATGARDNSRQANEAIAWLAAELGKANRRGDYLANRTDTLVSLILQQHSRHPEDFDEAPAPDPPVQDETVITGRHRFPTTSISMEQDHT